MQHDGSTGYATPEDASRRPGVCRDISGRIASPPQRLRRHTDSTRRPERQRVAGSMHCGASTDYATLLRTTQRLGIHRDAVRRDGLLIEATRRRSVDCNAWAYYATSSR